MTGVPNNFPDSLNTDELREEFESFTSSSGGDGSNPGIRNKILSRLKDFQANCRATIEKQLLNNGQGIVCAQHLAKLQDETIRLLYDFAVNHVYRVGIPSTSERMAIVSVGGYGRGTLAPESDLDLLFLLPSKQTPWGESVAEYVLHMLWDIGLNVGHSTRTVEDCLTYSKSDMIIRTSILDARLICGDDKLFDELENRYKAESVTGTEAAFINSKLEERDSRHHVQGSSRYLVEPNVKDGKGGLRDLNTLFWICKYVYQVNNISELVKAEVFSEEELKIFEKCEDFLWATRCNLHFATGRAVERLTFDVQRKIAKCLKHRSHAGLSEVESYMKHYFLIAKDVGDLTRILCATLEEQHIKNTRYLSKFIKTLPLPRKNRTIKGYSDFKIENQRINIANPDIFKNDPVNLIRMFHLASGKNLDLHPNAMKQARRSLDLIDNSVCQNETANQLFLDILTSRDNAESVLRFMNETGILGKFVPEFGRIVAMMQFNSYHHYTVDEHLLRAIGVLSEIERGELDSELPLSSKLIGEIENRIPLYVAVFLHDIAKGRDEDHSIAGARIANEICPRFGMNPDETELVAWLVEKHLEMNRIAQTRDLHDSKTIENFTEIVKTPERLKLLLILTAADIKAVGPGVFTGWKGQLLRTLYNESVSVLSDNHIELTRQQKIENAKSKLKESLEKLDEWSEDECKNYLERHYPDYWIREKLENQLEHAELFRMADKSDNKLLTKYSTHEFEANTTINVLTPDHPKLLTMIAGACVKENANIVDSQIFTTTDGLALDTIAISRKFENDWDERKRVERLILMIEKFITGQEYVIERINENYESKRLRSPRTFSHETKVQFSNSWSDMFTVIEISGLDRPGLLFDLTRKISDLNLNIASAHISTYGERAVDAFYVTDIFGQKITDKYRQEKMKRELCTAFDGIDEEEKTILSPNKQLENVG